MTKGLIGLSLVFLCPALPAWAEFGDCMDPAYLSRFIEAGSARDLTCVEAFRFTYDTPEGPRSIRAIMDAASDWAVPDRLVAGVERGAREAVAAVGGLGDFAVDDVTLLILDDRTDWGATADGEVQAVTDGFRDAAGARTGECLVTLFGLASGGTPEEIAVTVAHEYFHCVQFSSLSAAQMESYDDGGTWWIEGAAEYFSAVAVPGSRLFTDRSGSFDDAVAGGVALNDMAHEASPLFFWLGETRGMSALMPFQRSMAEGGGAAGQHAAMRAALPDADWLDFAKAYADAAIGHPQGGRLWLSPDFPPRLRINTPGTVTLSLPPFTLHLGQASYACGVWGNRPAPDAANLALRPASGGDWVPWPDETDAREIEASEFHFVGLHTGDAALPFSVTVERRQSCAPCAGRAELDACLIGTWEVTGGGPEDWMRAQGLPVRPEIRGPRIVTFQPDGGYATEPFGVAAEQSDGYVVMRGEGWVTTAFGNWSAAEGQLNICQSAGGMSGSVSVETPTDSGSMSVGRPGSGTLSQSYSCNGDSLTTTLGFSGMPDMVTSYGRIAGAGP